MNKITKYITTGAAAMLMLMSVGAVQTNANAARHYRSHVTRYSNKNVRHNKHQSKNNKKQEAQKKRANKANKINKQNKRTIKNTKRSYRKHIRKNAVRKYMKHNKRKLRRHINRRYDTRAVLKPRYRLIKGNKRGNRALQKSGFVDGTILAKMGYSQNYAKYIFNKYAPNDKRAMIPSYMNPKMNKLSKKFHIADYHNINNALWVQGRFSLKHPNKDTKNPKVYKYYPKLHGWKLAPRY